MSSSRRRVLRTGALIATTGLAGLFLASSAQAHVTVSSPNASQGGYATITIKVPTESATASTTGLLVQLPTDTPIASVSVQPHVGWTFTVTKTKLNPPITTDDGQVTETVSGIEWKSTSASAAIEPGEFDQFSISAGPLPKVSTLTFKAIQTYSDGSVVKWIEQAAPGSRSEPEHPAPTLQLAAATSSATTSSSPAPAPAAAASGGAGTASATTGIVLGAIGVVLGGAALTLMLVRRRATA